MAREAGGSRSWALFNVHLAAGMLREAAAAVTAPRGEVLAPQHPGTLSLAVREPVGVVAAFAPWNAPVILGTRAVAAPLAAGNTVVVKPSEDAPLACGYFVADVLREAGLPDGVLNVVSNAREDAAEVAEALVADPAVRTVNFTGSTGVGRVIGNLAARHLKPAVLELGGKNSVVVLEDADVDYAVDAATFAVFMNAGQICMSGDRILLHASLAEEFTREVHREGRRAAARRTHRSRHRHRPVGQRCLGRPRGGARRGRGGQGRTDTDRGRGAQRRRTSRHRAHRRHA